MAERGQYYCPQCGQEVGVEDRFCRNCGRHLSVPPLGEGRIETGRANLPPPPVPTTPSYGGGADSYEVSDSERVAASGSSWRR